MLSLLRRHPLLDSGWTKWAVGSLLNTSVLMGIFLYYRVTLPVGSSPSPLGNAALMAAAMWIPLAVFFLFHGVRQRCQFLDLGLPIPARKLWRAHLAVSGLAGLGLLAFSGFGVFWARHLTRMVETGMTDMAGLFVSCGVSLVWTVVLLQGPRPELREIPSNSSYMAYALLVLSLGYGWILLYFWWPGPAVLVPLAAALVVGIWNGRSLPEAFLIAPFQPGESQPTPLASPAREPLAGWEEESSVSAGSAGWRSAWFLFRSLSRVWMVKRFSLLGACLFLGFWGFFISGFFTSVFLDSAADYEMLNVILSGYVVFSFLGTPAGKLGFLDTLPVSRGRLFSVLVLPVLFSLGLGYGAGKIGIRFFDKPRELVALQQEKTEVLFPPYPSKVPGIRVPVNFCGIYWNGNVPEIRSPWGESHPAYALPLFKGSQTGLFSPFQVRGKPSAEFLAWQISLALDSAYGLKTSVEEIKTRLSSPGEGASLTGGNLLAPWQGATVLIPLEKPGIIPFLPYFSGLWFFFFFYWYLRANRNASTEARRKVVLYTVVGVALVLHLGWLFLLIAGFTSPWLVSGYCQLLLEEFAKSVPWGKGILFVAGASLLVGAYQLTLRQFRRMEAPAGGESR